MTVVWLCMPVCVLQDIKAVEHDCGYGRLGGGDASAMQQGAQHITVPWPLLCAIHRPAVSATGKRLRPRKQRKEKTTPFDRQFSEEPSIIPGCPTGVTSPKGHRASKTTAQLCCIDVNAAAGNGVA